MQKGNLLIVEDNSDLRQTLVDVFEKENYKVSSAETAHDAQVIVRKGLIDLMLLDLKLPDESGLKVLETVKDIDPDILVIMITAETDVQPAVNAMKKGAYDYLMKPFELAEVKMNVAKAFETRSLKQEVSRLKRQQLSEYPDWEIYGASKAMSELKEVIQMVAETPRTPVLIQGESGTGKELVANAIHNWSRRAEKPLIKLNCAAFPEHLLESELFGHEKGAFTDAKALRKGLFEMAHKGTIFLDEISSMSPSLQPKLLRILESQTFRRVGGMQDIQLDIRIVAASNRDLDEMVQNKEFREDLLYRLKVIDIQIPALRDRLVDLIPLAHIFLDRNNKEFGKQIEGITEEAKHILMHYKWPGNVRELKNMIERAAILCKGNMIMPLHLPVELRRQASDATTPTKPLDEVAPNSGPAPLSEMEKRHIVHTLNFFSGNKSRSARELGISRSTLREKMKLYGIPM